MARTPTQAPRRLHHGCRGVPVRGVATGCVSCQQAREGALRLRFRHALLRNRNDPPPGMPVGSERLSAGDIDGVARLYGKPPTATAISTHPPGLEIVVDGERIVTTAGPASRWFEAHCIVQRRTLGCADPPGVEAHPAAGSSRDFLHWGPAPDLPSRADRRNARSSPGPHRIPLRAAHARGLAGPPTGPGSVTSPQSTARRHAGSTRDRC